MANLNSLPSVWDDEDGILTYADWLEEIEKAKMRDKNDKPPTDKILDVIDLSDLCCAPVIFDNLEEDESRMFLVVL